MYTGADAGIGVDIRMEIVRFLDLHISEFARIALAILLGGAIGIEREFSGRPAGFRTHILVCLGACLMTVVDATMPNAGGRIAAQVVTGVGFLGAGTILRTDRGNSVHGLTTAASLWTTAGLGIALGYGPPTMWYAVVTAIVILLTLTVASVFEDAVLRHRRVYRLTISVKADGDRGERAAGALIARLATMGANIVNVSFDDDPDPQESQSARTIRATIRIGQSETREGVTQAISAVPGIAEINWDS
jgi:putative Mg2+ transporter-C (MgtC) family protein